VVQNGLSKEVLKIGLRTVPAAQLLPLACQQEQYEYDWLTAKCYKWVKHCYIQIKSTQYTQNYQRRCKCGPCTHTHTYTHSLYLLTQDDIHFVGQRRLSSWCRYMWTCDNFSVVSLSGRVVKCESTFKRQPSHSNDGHSKEGGVLDGSGNEYRVQDTKKHKSIGRVQPPRPKRKPEWHEFVKSVQQ
jgi:hypothetical protein